MSVSFCRKSVSWYTEELFHSKDNRNHPAFLLVFFFFRPLLTLKQSSHKHAVLMKRMGTKVFIAVYFYLVIFPSFFLPKSTPSFLCCPSRSPVTSFVFISYVFNVLSPSDLQSIKYVYHAF